MEKKYDAAYYLEREIREMGNVSNRDHFDRIGVTLGLTIELEKIRQLEMVGTMLERIASGQERIAIAIERI
jgi:hypothetical protein